MLGHNSTTYGHICCHTPTMPCLCPGCHASLYDYTYNHNYNPMIQWYNNHHLLPAYPQNPVNNPSNPVFFNQEAMVTNEIDPWLLINPDNGQNQNFNHYQGQFNPDQVINHHGNYGQQQHDEQMYDFSRAPLYNTDPGTFLNESLPAIVPEATRGNYSNTVDWSRVDEFSFLPFDHGNLIEEAVGRNSSSTEGKQLADASNMPLKFPPMSRQDKVLRYFEKKKTRKYEKKLIKYSARRTYAQIRPRIRGRFARRSQVDAQ